MIVIFEKKENLFLMSLKLNSVIIKNKLNFIKNSIFE